MLARAVREERAMTYTPSLKSKEGRKVNNSMEMAEIFREYYNTLYNLPHTGATPKEIRGVLRKFWNENYLTGDQGRPPFLQRRFMLQ